MAFHPHWSPHFDFLFFWISQWFFTPIGLHILFFSFFGFPNGCSPPLVSTFFVFLISQWFFNSHWSPHLGYLVVFCFPNGFSPPLVSTSWFSSLFFCFPNGFSPPVVSTSGLFAFVSQWFFTPHWSQLLICLWCPVLFIYCHFASRGYVLSPKFNGIMWFPMVSCGFLCLIKEMLSIKEGFSNDNQSTLYAYCSKGVLNQLL